MGVLYSYALALALVPAAAALIIDAPRWFAGRGPVRGTARTAALLAVLVVAAAGALALSQPAVLLTWGILVITWFSWWAISTAVASSGRRRMLLLVAVGGAWAVFVTVWILLTRSTSGSHWPPFRGKLEAVLDVVLNGQVLLPVMAGVSILMLVGLVVSVRRPPLRWLATAWVVSGSLYVVSAGIGNPFLRRWLLGAWYADPYRIAAAGAVVVVPLAAIGLAVIATWAAQAISARRGETAARFGAAWAIVAVAALGVILLIAAPMLQLRGVTDREIDTESRYATDEYLSPDERVLLERLDEHVPPGERVIGNPSTGMGFAYMLSAADVFPRTWAAPRTDPWRMIEQSLRQAGSDPAVCEALAAYGSPTYVLDFGLGEDSPGRYELPGMTGFEGKRGFELVDEQGDASLWRITACAP
nr:hypothetical protein GCM10025699_19440 [Microbacterium flavescens]